VIQVLKTKTVETLKTIKAIVTWLNTYVYAREEARKEEKESPKKSKENEDLDAQNDVLAEYGWCVNP
jgi:hypothetical protein